MGAKQRIMGACGCGEEKGREVEKTGKESWFKGSAKDVKKAKEAGAVVVSGKCAKTAKPVDCETKVKDGDGLWFRGDPAKLKAACVEAPKEADATEAAELEKANPAPSRPSSRSSGRCSSCRRCGEEARRCGEEARSGGPSCRRAGPSCS